jgi:molybdopterin converting factor small subunit
MNITVEFPGGGRAMTGTREVTLSLPDSATYRDVVRRLAQMYPRLVGAIIAANGNSLLSAMIFNRNGEESILPAMLDQSPREGDRLILMFFIVGG